MAPNASKRQPKHGLWSSQIGFMLAAVGSAVGLGNVWRFPYMVGENGGGAFVLVYIFCIFVLGIPVFMSEVMLGRIGRRNPINTYRFLAAENNLSRRWCWLGGLGVLAGFLILSFYSVIAGWILKYVRLSMSGDFSGATAEGVEQTFKLFTGDPVQLIIWHSVFMAIAILVVSRGVSGGLEKANRYLMPALFVLLVGMVGYATTTGKMSDAIAFMFAPDFSELTGAGILAAMGMAFFSLSVGMSAMVMYGAYLPDDVSIGKTSAIISLSDLLVACLAGLAIFPIVIANGLEFSAGPGLVFKTLPLAFSQMQGGVLVGTLFFVLLMFASITSALGMLEITATWFIESKGMSRKRAVTVCGLITWFIGLGTVFSFNIWSGYTWSLGFTLGDLSLYLFQDKNFFETVDFAVSNFIMPVSGFLTVIFVGYLLGRRVCRDELGLGSIYFKAWYLGVRYVAPVLLLIVFVYNLVSGSGGE